MSGAKHTPGPWNVTTDIQGHDAISCGAWLVLRASVGSAVVSEDEHKANLNLCAAAPDMADTLREIECMPASMVNDSDSLRHTIQTIKYMARAALAKADVK